MKWIKSRNRNIVDDKWRRQFSTFKVCVLSQSWDIRRNVSRKIIELSTVEPGFNEPLFNECLDITNDTLRPGQNYSKMYGIAPRYNEPLYNEFLDITNIIGKPKRILYFDITNYNVNPRQKINAEQMNSQQIL